MRLAIAEPTLVLDKCWQATNATTAKKAIKTVVADRARFLDYQTSNLYGIEEWSKLPITDKHRAVVTGGLILRAPTLIVLNRFNDALLNKKRKNGRPIRSVVFSRKNLFKRDRYRCQYCGCKPAPSELSIDHVVPKSMWNPEWGCVSSFENCVLACTRCNKRKANQSLASCGMRLQRLVRGPDGKVHVEFYERPEIPQWSPLYAIARIEKWPEDWNDFLKMKNDELYWNIALED